MDNKNNNLINIILCGGIGSRLWPLSNVDYPKQFLNFYNEFSLFQNTILRNNKITNKTIIVTNKKYLQIIDTQTKKLKKNIDKIIIEPVGRNTAAAITLACLSLCEDDIVLITPSDHFIKKNVNYFNAVKKAKILAKSGYIVTFGIKPTYPETEYGYIKVNGENTVSFHEKPDMKTAKKYFVSKNNYWNSGIFLFKVQTYLNELQKYSNRIYESSLKAYNNSVISKNRISIKNNFMLNIPDNSIDYAVLEKSRKIKMMSTDIIWSDLGNFDALYNFSKLDNNGNFSKSKNISINSFRNYLSTNNKLNVLIDVDDLIVINSSDILLICKRGSSQKIKQLFPL